MNTLPFFALIGSASLCFAAKNAELKPILTAPGKPAFEAGCSAGPLSETWKLAKGDWQIKDGAIVGKEKAEDKHAAVLSLNLPKRDSAIQFSFKLDGAKSLALSLNHAKGHLFRVIIAPDGIRLQTDKDKKDAASKSELLGKSDTKFTNGEWHTILVEMKGTKVALQTDNGVKLEAAHPSLDTDKTGYRFVTQGESVAIDDVKVWNAVTAP